MSVKPSYCPDCRKSNTYQRILAMDMKGELDTADIETAGCDAENDAINEAKSTAQDCPQD